MDFEKHCYEQMTHVPKATKELVEKATSSASISKFLTFLVGISMWTTVFITRFNISEDYVHHIVLLLLGIAIGVLFMFRFGQIKDANFTYMIAFAKFHERVAQFSFNAGALAAFRNLTKEKCYDETLPISLALAHGDCNGAAIAMERAGKRILESAYP